MYKEVKKFLKSIGCIGLKEQNKKLYILYFDPKSPNDIIKFCESKNLCFCYDLKTYVNIKGEVHIAQKSFWIEPEQNLYM